MEIELIDMVRIITYLKFSDYTTLIFLSLATIAMGIVNIIRSRRYNISVLRCLWMTVVNLAASYFGAKILYILESFMSGGSGEFGSFTGGFSMFGAFLLFPLGIFLIAKASAYSVGKMYDFFTPGLLVLLGVQRIGCFFSGCCGGPDIPIGSSFVWTFPVQLEEMICDFIICLVILGLERTGKCSGKLLLYAQIMYGFVRFNLEFIRETEKNWFGMSHGQVFSLILIAVSIIVLVILKKKHFTQTSISLE